MSDDAERDLHEAMGRTLGGIRSGRPLVVTPSLKLRIQLSEFALSHNLTSEDQAVLVILLRYFRIVRTLKAFGTLKFRRAVTPKSGRGPDLI